MKKYFIPSVIALFAVISVLLYVLKQAEAGYDYKLLMGGNILMAVLSLLGYFIVTRQLNKRTQAFVRGVYSATFLKLMVTMGSILLYILLNRATLHKPSVFAVLGIYMLYTILETVILSNTARREV